MGDNDFTGARVGTRRGLDAWSTWDEYMSELAEITPTIARPIDMELLARLVGESDGTSWRMRDMPVTEFFDIVLQIRESDKR